MRIAFIAIACVFASSAGAAQPTAVDEKLCDYFAKSDVHIAQLRASGYTQGDAAKRLGQIIGKSFDDPKMREGFAQDATKRLQEIYSMPISDVMNAASNPAALKLHIYEQCMHSGN